MGIQRTPPHATMPPRNMALWRGLSRDHGLYKAWICLKKVALKGEPEPLDSHDIPFPETNSKSTWKWMVGLTILLGQKAYLWAKTVSFRECNILNVQGLQTSSVPNSWRWPGAHPSQQEIFVFRCTTPPKFNFDTKNIQKWWFGKCMNMYLLSNMAMFNIYVLKKFRGVQPRSFTVRPWKMVVGRRSSPIWDSVTFQGQSVKLREGIPSSLFPNVF